MMSYINIEDALPLRDGAGSLHAKIGLGADGNCVWTTKKRNQIIQCVLFPYQRLVITRFKEAEDERYVFLDEQVILLPSKLGEEGVSK